MNVAAEENPSQNSNVVVFETPASLVWRRESEPKPEWSESWAQDVAGVRPFDLMVIPEDAELTVLQQVREKFPESDLAVVSSPDDARLELFLGDQAVFFLPPPDSMMQLYACVREILSYREECRKTREGGDSVPTVREEEPVAGWLELTGPTHPVFLRRFRTWIESLQDLPWDEKERRKLVHAVREVGWNAIEWGNRFDLRRAMRLAFLRLEDRVLFRIEDEGEPDDWHVRERPQDAVSEQLQRAEQGIRYGGLGLTLVERIMDGVEVSSNGNIVVMEKRFAAMRSSQRAASRAKELS